MVFVRDRDRREDGDCHGQWKAGSAVEILPGVLSRANAGGRVRNGESPQFHAEFGVRELGKLPNHPCLTRPRLVILIKAVRAHDENSNSVRDQPTNGRILHCR